MNEEYEIYGYAVEILNKYIGPRTGEYLGEDWTYYNKKVYDTEEIAKRAIEENPYKHGEDGYMSDYRIIPLYKIVG